MKQAIITWKSAVLMLLLCLPMGLKAQSVKGTVTDAQNGEPLIVPRSIEEAKKIIDGE